MRINFCVEPIFISAKKSCLFVSLSVLAACGSNNQMQLQDDDSSQMVDVKKDASKETARELAPVWTSEVLAPLAIGGRSPKQIWNTQAQAPRADIARFSFDYIALKSGRLILNKSDSLVWTTDSCLNHSVEPQLNVQWFEVLNSDVRQVQFDSSGDHLELPFRKGYAYRLSIDWPRLQRDYGTCASVSLSVALYERLGLNLIENHLPDIQP